MLTTKGARPIKGQVSNIDPDSFARGRKHNKQALLHSSQLMAVPRTMSPQMDSLASVYYNVNTNK
jgi:hypothetical protein